MPNGNDPKPQKKQEKPRTTGTPDLDHPDVVPGAIDEDVKRSINAAADLRFARRTKKLALTLGWQPRVRRGIQRMPKRREFKCPTMKSIYFVRSSHLPAKSENHSVSG